MKQYLRNDEVTKRRFDNECMVLSSLQKVDRLNGRIPNFICSEFPYLVKEYISGCTLQQWKIK